MFPCETLRDGKEMLRWVKGSIASATIVIVLARIASNRLSLPVAQISIRH